MPDTTTQEINLKSAMPGFAVADLTRSLAFYNGQLGFETVFTNGPKENPVFAIVKRGAVWLSLASNVAESRIGQGAVYLTVTGVDALYGELQAAGIDMAHQLRYEEYGMREFMIADPDGNTINFGEDTE